MGRPLKIQKYNASTSTPIDQAYPPFSQLTAPTPPVGTNPAWLGVVGGVRGGGVSAVYEITLFVLFLATQRVVGFDKFIGGGGGSWYFSLVSCDAKYVYAMPPVCKSVHHSIQFRVE